MKGLEESYYLNNHSEFPMYFYMARLCELGYETKFDCRVSSTRVYSSVPVAVNRVILDLVNKIDVTREMEDNSEEFYWTLYDENTGEKRVFVKGLNL